MLYLCPIERERVEQDTITDREETGLNRSQQPAIRNVNTLLLCLRRGCLLKSPSLLLDFAFRII